MVASGMSMDVVWNGGEAIQATDDAAVRGLTRGGHHVRGVAVNRTPIDTADLRNSAHVEVDDAEMTSAVSYDTPYAVRQHESLGFYHFTGQAKFLESAAQDEGDTARDILAAELRRAHRS